MTLFYTLLYATLLTTHLWAATAGDEGAESDDFLTEKFKSCRFGGYIIKTFGPEKWEEMQANVRAEFTAQVPAGFRLTTPEEFQMEQSIKIELVPSREDRFKCYQSCLLRETHQAFYDSEMERIKPVWDAFDASEKELRTAYTWKQEFDLMKQLETAVHSADREQAFIALLPEEVRPIGLNKEGLKKASFMLFSEPVVASPMWDALPEADVKKRRFDAYVIDKILNTLRDETYPRRALNVWEPMMADIPYLYGPEAFNKPRHHLKCVTH